MTITDIILLFLILVLIKIISMIEKVSATQCDIRQELVKHNERATDTNILCKNSSEHIHKMLVIKEYEDKHKVIDIQGSQGSKVYGCTEKDAESSELTLDEVYAVIMESLENCPKELKDTKAVKDSIATFTDNINLLKTYADEVIDRISKNNVTLSEKAIKEIVISDLRLING